MSSLREQMKERRDQVVDWIGEHKGDILYGIYASACAAAVIAGIARKSSLTRREVRRDRQVYDPSMGFYWETKRKLTNNQKLLIEQRHRNGEPYGKILKEMNLLKR